ncbi:ceramide-1-phosphate transfer protein [Cololabis saira]|uniref:ceramide-1-phosphate transfer protein n=1 Tax=Cololabis saira TaxID=129043 RepID=UPI002AD227EB|nr:ceramide-1-phosphate transfer protein [Cololabis saira]
MSTRRCVVMLLLRRRRVLLLALALLLFFTSFWLPQGGTGGCGTAWQPCLMSGRQTVEPPLVPEEWAGPGGAPPPIQHCPGQQFQTRFLLRFLKSSLEDEDDVLLEPYLQSWDQLLNFMESLGTMVSFFSQKVKEKVVLIRQLSLQRPLVADGKQAGGPGPGPGPGPGGSNTEYRSLRSMMAAELKAGLVGFSRRTDSGCRTLLRLHRSLLWLKLLLDGLAEGPDGDGRYRSPGELSRDAYQVALAPHHPWVLRQAAELVFLALPERRHFLRLVCVTEQREATPILRVIIHALAQVHGRTQRILAEQGMLALP